MTKCNLCGVIKKTGRIPSFWSVDCGYEVIEYQHQAVLERRTDLFSPQIHRNQGYQGSGKCEVEDCKVCEMLRLHGA